MRQTKKATQGGEGKKEGEMGGSPGGTESLKSQQANGVKGGEMPPLWGGHNKMT